MRGHAGVRERLCATLAEGVAGEFLRLEAGLPQGAADLAEEKVA